MGVRRLAIPLLLSSLSVLPVLATEVRVAAEGTVRVLERHRLPEGAVAVALSPGGESLAYALPTGGGREGFSEVVRVSLDSTDEPTAVAFSLPGQVRDLLFLDTGELLGLQYRPAKKRIGDTFLFRAAPGDDKPQRVMRVPPSSSDLDRWPAGGAILLACRNEIRTILPPDYRSGPLFSVPGDNFAVSSLGSSSFVLVGQTDALLLIDLGAPSGRDSMPVLTRRSVPAPVRALADYPSGSDLLVRLEDGRLFEASFDPLAFREIGRADQIAGLAKATEGPELPFATPPVASAETKNVAGQVEEPAATDVTETISQEAATIAALEPPEEETPEAPGEDETVDVAETTAVARAPAAEVPKDDAPSVEPQGGEPVLAAQRVEEPPAEAVAPQQAPGPAPTRQLSGRLVGNLALVREVVLLGPDNILREAARLRPEADGSWGLDGLDPGRYRILVDGGGDRVLVAEPRFLVVEVGEQPVVAPEIKVVSEF